MLNYVYIWYIDIDCVHCFLQNLCRLHIWDTCILNGVFNEFVIKHVNDSFISRCCSLQVNEERVELLSENMKYIFSASFVHKTCIKLAFLHRNVDLNEPSVY